MLIRLSGELQKYTEGKTEHETSGTTVGECLNELFNRFPQLLVNLTAGEGQLARRHLCHLDGEIIEAVESCKLPVDGSSILEMSQAVPVGASTTVLKVVGVLMVVIGTILLFVPGFQFMGAMLIINGLRLLHTINTMRKPTATSAGTLNNSATYGFDGMTNTTASGTPFSIVYGTHRAAGQVLNLYTEAGNAEEVNGVELRQTLLLAQIGVCEGPVTEMSDVQLNKIPAYYYAAVESAHNNADLVRLGEATQEIMPHFSEVRGTNSVGYKITNLVSPP